MQREVSIRKQFLQHLATGKMVNGARLAQQLGCSRAAISRQAAVLKIQGLSLSAEPGKGYRLASPLSLLDKSEIASYLSAPTRLHVHDQLVSTNQFLMTAPRVEDGEACLAEFQTAGRGRLGREWWGSAYRNILLSMVWDWSQGPAALSGFSLAAGVAVVESLSAWKLPNLVLKWPNDILCLGRKLGGILVEIRGEGEGPCRVVLGLGLNVHNTELPASLSAQVIDMQAAGAMLVDRNQLAGALIAGLGSIMKEFREYGFAPFQTRWNAMHAYRGQRVLISGGRHAVCGKALGVDYRGVLTIKDDDGVLHDCTGGELSLRTGNLQ